jgi:hypothetical protein
MQARYARAETALSHLDLPAEIRREPARRCATDTAVVCGRTSRTPPELSALLRRIVPDGHVFLAAHAARCLGRTPLCPLTVIGRFDGFRMIAIAIWHLVSGNGRPPRGAVRFLHDGARLHPAFTGSDITISLASPNPQ